MKHNVLNASKVLQYIMDTNCPHCDFDEAEGGLLNHCPRCAQKIVTELHRRSLSAVQSALKALAARKERKSS